MPRRSRILLDDIPLHIVQRGHNREPCFFAEDDYHTYLHWLAEALKAHRAALHAYALMTSGLKGPGSPFPSMLPRRPRILLDGIPLHIVQRSHNREPSFFADEDDHTLAVNVTPAPVLGSMNRPPGSVDTSV
jgi:REP element-mobilizing transposase RayT